MGYGLDGWGSDSLQEQEILLYSTVYREALEPTQPLTQQVHLSPGKVARA
jgi:hypothetical protein